VSEIPRKFLRASLSINYLFNEDEVNEYLAENPDFGAESLLGFSDPLERRLAINQMFTPDKPIVHLTLGADETFFYPPNPANIWDRPPSAENLRLWVRDSVAWIKKNFGEDGLQTDFCPANLKLKPYRPPSIRLWMSDSTSRKSALFQRDFPWPRALKSYGDALAGLGLAPPPIALKPTAEEIARYYRASNDATFYPDVDLRRFARIPEATPNSTDEASLLKRTSEAATLTMEAAKDVLEDLDFRVRVAKFETERAKYLLYKDKINYHFNLQKRRRYELLAAPCDGARPAEVLTRIFGAEKAFFDPPFSEIFRLPDGRQFETKGFKWRDLSDGAADDGAFSLVQKLGEVDEDGAIIYLMGYFTYEETLRTLNYHAAAHAEAMAREAMKIPFEPPTTTEATWPEVRNYLAEDFGLPLGVLEAAHANRAILTTPLNMIVFVCAGLTGMFFMFVQKTGGKLPNVERPYAESHPFHLHGTGEPVYLTDHPIEALSLKALYPESPVMAIGELSPPEAVSSYLNGRKAIATVRPGCAGHKLARQLKTLNLPVQKVPKGLSWNEFWRSRN
jgi:hypothetical protein